MRQRLTLRRRLLFSAASLIFFVLVASALGFWYARTAVTALDASQEGIDQINRLSSLEAAWNDVSASIDRMLLTRQTTMIDGELSGSLVVFNAALQEISDHALGIDAATVASNAEIAADLQFFGEELNLVVGRIQDAARERHWPRAQVLRHTELASLQNRFDRGLTELRRSTSVDVEALVAESARRQRAFTGYLVAGLLVSIAIGAALTVAGVRAIIEPIHQLIDRTRRVTEGDFSYVAPLQRDDEIGQLASSFSIMTEWLADSYKVLEERVDERTRELALAAEVGRSLGRVRDLDSLLKEAVELIRARFDLYYTQVYLVGEGDRSLILHAGTGEVGEELRRRGFKLPIDRGSINGSAAYERRPVIIADTEQSGRFRPNPLLPDTASEIAMPLLVGERVVGVLDLQSSQRYGLGEESLAAYEVLAGQLAIAIENALLFTESRAARTELENQAQARISENWATFLDAIERPERIAYSYSAGALKAEPKMDVVEVVGDNSLSAPIELNDVALGHIRLKAQPQQRWTAQDLQVVEDVARLVAQQVENLRLLAEAQRYRDEAETTLRRVTQASWREMSEAVGAYQYDGRQVRALTGEAAAHDVAFPLQIRGQTVGEFAVAATPAGAASDEEATELVAAVAGRLSAHLENLRLSRQTQWALADVQRRSQELEELNRIVTRIGSTLDLRNSLQIVVEELVSLTTADQARIGLLNTDRSALTIVSEEFDATRSPSALGLTIPVEGNALTQEVLNTGKTVVIEDARSHPLTRPIRQMLSEQGIHTMIVLPILAGNEVIGTVGADILSDGVAFQEEDLRLAETVVFQAATAIQNARLFEQIQNTLAETRALYRASAELNRARSYDDLIDVLRQHSIAGDGSTTLSLALFETPWTESSTPRWIDILAYWSAEAVDEPKLRFNLEDYPAMAIMERDRHALVDDVASDPRLDVRSRRMLLHGFKARSVLAAPLVAGGQWIGHINALFPEPRNFTDAELQQLQNLVGQAAVAVQSINLLEETNRLLESEQRQRRISDALVRATSRMLGVMDEQHIRELVVEEIENLLAPDQISLYRWQTDEDLLVVEQRRVIRGTQRDAYQEGQSILEQARPDLWSALRSGESHLQHLPAADDRIHQQYIVPWQVGNDIAGVVELFHTARGGEIRQEDQASVEGIIQQAAIRLQSARLFEEAERHATETEALYRASRTINTASSYREVLDALCQNTLLGINSRSIAIYYFDQPWSAAQTPEWMELLAQRGDDAVGPVMKRYRLDSFPAAAEILSPDDVTIVYDVTQDARLDAESRARYLPSGNGASAAAAASVLFVPLLAGGQWLGYIEALYGAPVSVGEDDRRRLLALASQASATLQGLHLLRQAQLRAQRERVLREITERVRSATDVDVIMKTAVREVGRALGRDAFVMLENQQADGANGAPAQDLNGGQAD